MIDDYISRLAADAFVRATSGKWGRPRAEIQDGGTFVLLSVDALAFEPKEIEAQDRSSVIKALNAFMPVKAEQEFGTWMVIFLRNGQVYESILPDEL
jgi:hypothetical protein